MHRNVPPDLNREVRGRDDAGEAEADEGARADRSETRRPEGVETGDADGADAQDCDEGEVPDHRGEVAVEDVVEVGHKGTDSQDGYSRVVKSGKKNEEIGLLRERRTTFQRK